MESKLALARGIVERWHGEEAAGAAEEHFTRVVREGEAPEEVAEAALPDGDVVHLPALLVERFGLGSTSEARRLIAQGGVRIDGEPWSGARRPARAARRDGLSRRESGASCASAPLDRRPAIVAIMAVASREAA